MALSHSDVRHLLDLLDRAEHLDALSIRVGDFVLQASKNGAAALAPPMTSPPADAASVAPAAGAAAPSAAATATPSEAEVPTGMTAVRAPMLGTFYRTPAPDQPPFVAEGSAVAADATLCLVEVMKLFNTVKTPVAGRVHRILAEHGKLVEHGQILMLIEPEPRS
ncbi:MAG TPA: acetyl-CoA carboxylase biotin carboxyl carrier protein [Burkholderiaceae bacterium]|nr:acetyl-CoA carboxylase biotin carboxyl carrier protein [Burkholderiaceae bacterium]